MMTEPTTAREKEREAIDRILRGVRGMSEETRAYTTKSILYALAELAALRSQEQPQGEPEYTVRWRRPQDDEEFVCSGLTQQVLVRRLIGGVSNFGSVTITALHRGVPTEAPAGESELRERIALLTAHRACLGVEHDPPNGKLHGYCVVCGWPWPCPVAGVPASLYDDATPSQEGVDES